MAQILSASIYGVNGYDQGNTNGLTKGFPVQNILIESIANDPQTFSGVSCISKVTLLPTGLNVKGLQYYTPTAAATLITAANA